MPRTRNTPNTPVGYTAREVAALKGCSNSTVHKAVAEGLLEKDPATGLITPASVEAFTPQSRRAAPLTVDKAFERVELALTTLRRAVTEAAEVKREAIRAEVRIELLNLLKGK